MAYATITRAGSGKSDHSTDTTTFTAALSGVLPGDVIDFTVTTTSSTATTLTPVNSTGALFPSGVGTGDNVQSQGWYFVVGSSVPTNLVVNLAAARQGTLAWIAYRGVDNTTPLDVAVSAGAQDPAQTTTPAMPSITTVTPGAMIAGGLCHGGGSTTVTSFPSGWSLVVDGTRRNGMIFEKGIQASAGATGTATFTLSGTQQNRMWIVAHRPAVVADPLEATLTTETYPGFTDDVADGAAIVYDSSDPSSSVVITTNKATGGGLYVLDLDGQIMSSNLDGAANSVDWRDLTGVSGWDNRLLVMTCDREDNLLRYYWMNRTTKALTSAGTYSLGWEPYGTCLYVHSTGQVYAFVTQRGSDDVSPRNMYQFPLSRSSETVSTGSVARTIALASVVEGLAADDTTGYLFASEEDVGLFRYSASPSGGSSRTTVDTAGGGNLVADVEDVAIARSPAGAWLLVSSQGDSTYHVYDLATLAHEQSFTVVRPGGSDTVTSTDGLDVYLGNFGGSFPDGLIVVHDGDKTPISDFAFVDAGLVFGDLPADPPGEGGGAASFGYSVAGTGSTTRTGGGAAAYALATAGSGAAALSGGGSAAYALGVTGTGTATHSGAGSTGYALTTDGTGSAPAVGAASGGGATGYDLAVTGTGSAPAVGSAGGGGSVGYTVTVTGTGTMQPGGGGTAAYALTAVGTGGTVKGGGGSVGYLYVGTGTGSAPIPGVSAGGGEAGYALATIGTGSTTRSGSGSTGLALTVAGTGTATRTGGGTVAIAYAVTGTGINPDTLIPVWPATIHLRVVDTTIGLRADDDTITLKETP